MKPTPNGSLQFALRDNDLVRESVEAEFIRQETAIDLCYLPTDPRIKCLPDDLQAMAHQDFHGDVDVMTEAATRYQFHRTPPRWARETLAAARNHWRRTTS